MNYPDWPPVSWGSWGAGFLSRRECAEAGEEALASTVLSLGPWRGALRAGAPPVRPTHRPYPQGHGRGMAEQLSFFY